MLLLSFSTNQQTPAGQPVNTHMIPELQQDGYHQLFNAEKVGDI